MIGTRSKIYQEQAHIEGISKEAEVEAAASAKIKRISIGASLTAPALDLVAIHPGDLQKRQTAANLGGHASREVVSVELELDQRLEFHEFQGDRPREPIAAEIELDCAKETGSGKRRAMVSF